jgi:hypothetical protein
MVTHREVALIQIKEPAPLVARNGSGIRAWRCLLIADIVAKVENQMTPKILRKPLFKDSLQPQCSLKPIRMSAVVLV